MKTNEHDVDYNHTLIQYAKHIHEGAIPIYTYFSTPSQIPL